MGVLPDKRKGAQNPMPKILGLAQVAIATPELDALKWIFSDHFGLTEFHDEEIPTQGVNVSSVALNGAALEMIAPSNTQSGLHKFLEKKGPGLHHIAFWVDDIEGWLSKLKAKGVLRDLGWFLVKKTIFKR